MTYSQGRQARGHITQSKEYRQGNWEMGFKQMSEVELKHRQMWRWDRNKFSWQEIQHEKFRWGTLSISVSGIEGNLICLEQKKNGWV
jgi:hypothetical protein